MTETAHGGEQAVDHVDANQINQAMSAGTATRAEVVSLIAASLGWWADETAIRTQDGLVIGADWAAVGRQVNRFGGIARDDEGGLAIHWTALIDLEASLFERSTG